MKGRLNLFQSAMLRWRTLHPYLAVHAMRVDEPLDARRLAQAIRATLERNGLSGFALDARRRAYEWLGGPSNVALDTIAAGDIDAGLDARIARELDAPFPVDGRYEPFRAFAVHDRERFYVAIAYDHLVAGGDCLVALLAQIAHAYRGQPLELPPPDRYPPRYGRLFRRELRALPRNVLALRSAARSCRRSVRPRYRDVEDGRNGFVRHTLSPEETRAVRTTAKAWGVTLNDLLIALLMVALARTSTARDFGARRHEIAVASIMNLRAAFGLAPRSAFAPFLGSMRVAHPVPPGVTLRDVAADVHAATSRVKRERLFLQNLLGVAANAFIWRFHDRRQRAGHYAKSYPVLAGISALNVSDLWPNGPETSPIYVRAVSTGPVAPIVLAVSTSADRLEAGFSYRTASVSDRELDKLWADVQASVRDMR